MLPPWETMAPLSVGVEYSAAAAAALLCIVIQKEKKTVQRTVVETILQIRSTRHSSRRSREFQIVRVDVESFSH